jgi:F-type H+-transporting ATPase subunit epsilon
MKRFLVKIITPEKKMYEHVVVSATFPTPGGEVTILPDHQPIIAAISSGELRVQDEQGRVEAFFADTGVARMQENELVVLLDRLESVNALTIDHAEEAYERARKLKDDAGKMQALDFARFEALLERELGRVRVARKYKR